MQELYVALTCARLWAIDTFLLEGEPMRRSSSYYKTRGSDVGRTDVNESDDYARPQALAFARVVY